MEIPMLPTRHNLLESGSYRVKVGECHIIEDRLGTWVVIGFDLMEKGLSPRSVKAWTNAELIGGERPSPLYSWISALEFGGEALPEEYSLETASLLLREAWAVIEVVDDGGLPYNRIARLSPCRIEQWHHEDTPRRQDAGPASWEYGESPAASPDEGDCLNSPQSNPEGLPGIFDPETHPEGLRGDFVEEPPW